MTCLYFVGAFLLFVAFSATRCKILSRFNDPAQSDVELAEHRTMHRQRHMRTKYIIVTVQ